jgi:hypothetical protein
MSSSSGILSQVIHQGLFAFPALLVYAIAMGLALVNLSRHPRPAKFTLVGSGLLLVSNILLMGMRILALADKGLSSAEFFRLTTIIGFVDVAVDFFGLLMIVSAIFLDRFPANSAIPAYATPITPNAPPPPFHSN